MVDSKLLDVFCEGYIQYIKRVYQLIAILLLLITSCDSSKNKSEIVLIGRDSLHFDFEENNERSIKFFEIEGNKLITYLSNNDSILTLVDFDSKKILDIWILPNFESDSRVSSYSLINLQKALYLTYEEVVIADKLGDDYYRWWFDKKQYFEDTSQVILSSINGFAELIFFNENEFFTPQYNYFFLWKNLEFYLTPVEALVNLKNKRIRTGKTIHPNIHRKHYFGELHNYYRCKGHDDKLVYSFMSHSNIFTEAADHELSTFPAKSSFHKTNLSALNYGVDLDFNISVNHLIANPVYLNIFYDNRLDVYYRFFWMPSENSNSLNQQISDKELVFMVLDTDFEILNEKKIGKNYGWFFSFNTPEGLYIRKFDDNLNYINYEIFDFQ